MHLKNLGNLSNALQSIGSSSNNINIISNAIANLSKENAIAVITTTTLSNKEKIELLMSKGCTKEEAKQAVMTHTLAASQESATATTGGLSTAFNGLAASLGISTTALAGITAGLAVFAAGMVAFKMYRQHMEEVRRTTSEAADTFSESRKAIEDYKNRYIELRSALIAANGNETKTYEIKKQLLELQTELNDKFGEEYGRLNLVTDAYKSQTEAIQAYNRKTAQTYLNENQEGITDATEQMTTKKHYNLSLTGISSSSEVGILLNELVKQFADRGVQMNKRRIKYETNSRRIQYVP